MFKDNGSIVVPLAEEQASLTKAKNITGRVRVSRVSCESEQLINAPVTVESVEVERTPVGRPIDSMPPVREEGGTLIIPVVEEVLVIERRLFLKEEVRVRRVQRTKQHKECVVLRKQKVVVTRHRGTKQEAAESTVALTKKDS